MMILFLLVLLTLLSPPLGAEPTPCGEAARQAGERIAREKVADHPSLIWKEFSRGELHCGAMTGTDFLAVASRLGEGPAGERQKTLRSWIESDPFRLLDRVCSDGRTKLQEVLAQPPAEDRTATLIDRCGIGRRGRPDGRYNIFKEADPVTFLAVQILRSRWEEKGVMTEAHDLLLRLLLHASAHEQDRPLPLTVGEEEDAAILRNVVMPYARERYGEKVEVQPHLSYPPVHLFLAFLEEESRGSRRKIEIAATAKGVLGDSRSNGFGETLKALRFHESHQPTGNELIQLYEFFVEPQHVVAREPQPEFEQKADGSFLFSYWRRLLSGDSSATKVTVQVDRKYRVKSW